MNATLRPLSALALLLWGCGELETVEGNPCSKGPDCFYPSVCCTDPRIPPIGATIPFCEDIDYCNAFLPVLVEGNPCHRSGANSLDECSEPWLCCPTTLTCLTAEACESAVRVEPIDMGPPPDGGMDSGVSEMPQSLPCAADPDCPQGYVCMGINLTNRDNGQCQRLPPQSP